MNIRKLYFDRAKLLSPLSYLMIHEFSVGFCRSNKGKLLKQEII